MEENVLFNMRSSPVFSRRVEENHEQPQGSRCSAEVRAEYLSRTSQKC
jgi:hypothetical protein